MKKKAMEEFYAHNFEKVEIYWFRLVCLYVCMCGYVLCVCVVCVCGGVCV